MLNRAQETNFPLKNLDGPSQGVKAPTSLSTARMNSTPSLTASTADRVLHMHFIRHSKCSNVCLQPPRQPQLPFINPLLHFSLETAVQGAPNGFARTVAYGLPAFAFVTSLIAIETHGWTTQSRLITRLGAASYCIYLLHPYVVGILRKLFATQPDLSSWQGAAMVLIVIAVICVIGDLCHVLIEKPMLVVLNRRFRQPKARGGNPP